MTDKPERPTAESILKWAAEQKWFMTGRAMDLQGRNYTFLTPAGNIVTIKAALDGRITIGIPRIGG